jgi:hypothetical protein
MKNYFKLFFTACLIAGAATIAGGCSDDNPVNVYNVVKPTTKTAVINTYDSVIYIPNSTNVTYDILHGNMVTVWNGDSSLFVISIDSVRYLDSGR